MSLIDTTTALPDSRSKGGKGQWRDETGRWWQPVYCANCGKNCGSVTRDSITGAFFLCDQTCADAWGEVASGLLEPDLLFTQRLVGEILERYGRELSPAELFRVLSDRDHPLSKLLRERDQEINALRAT